MMDAWRWEMGKTERYKKEWKYKVSIAISIGGLTVKVGLLDKYQNKAK